MVAGKKRTNIISDVLRQKLRGKEVQRPCKRGREGEADEMYKRSRRRKEKKRARERRIPIKGGKGTKVKGKKRTGRKRENERIDG